MSKIFIVEDDVVEEAEREIERSDELADAGSTDDELETLHEIRDTLEGILDSSHDQTAVLDALIEENGVQWVEGYLKSLGARSEFDASDVIA